MKNKLLIISGILLTSFFSSFSQVIESGTLLYEEVMKIEIKLEGEMAALMKDFPKERKSTKILYFNKEASLFENSKSEEPVDMAGFDGHTGGIRVMMQEPDNKLFIDLKKKKIIEKRDFMTRIFLITAELPDIAWKITGNQKMILEYPCMEAVSTDTAGIRTIAWFSPFNSHFFHLFCNNFIEFFL